MLTRLLRTEVRLSLRTSVSATLCAAEGSSTTARGGTAVLGGERARWTAWGEQRALVQVGNEMRG